MNSKSEIIVQIKTESIEQNSVPRKIKPTHKCSECEFTADTKLLIKKHMILNHPNEIQKYKCTFCQKVFKDSSQLENHVNVHTGNKPHKCSDCELNFSTLGELTRHTRYKHTLEKPHKCTLCDYSTVELSKLKRHQRVHTDERPYVCPFCEYASKDTFKLKRHIRIHTGEKPYKCPICSEAFSQSNSLKAHMKKHSLKTIADKTSSTNLENLPGSSKALIKTSDELGLYECKECSMKFTSQKVLEDHYIEHTGERPYVCDICQMKFARTSSLRFHKLSHNEEHTRDLKEHLNSVNAKTKYVNENILSNSSQKDELLSNMNESAIRAKRKRKNSIDSSNELNVSTQSNKLIKLNEN